MSTTENTTTEVEAIEKGAALLRNEGVSWSDVVKAIAPVSPPAVNKQAEYLPVEITDEERAALARITDIFGAVSPAERRTLTPDEANTLSVERATLKTIEGMVARRTAEIRSTVYHALDAEVDEGMAEDDEPHERDKDGFYILPGSVPIPAEGQRFSREVRAGSVKMDSETLAEIAKDETQGDFSWDDYLAMTTQVRVFDEAKATLALRKRPELLSVIRKAVTRGRPTTSMFVRKAK